MSRLLGFESHLTFGVRSHGLDSFFFCNFFDQGPEGQPQEHKDETKHETGHKKSDASKEDFLIRLEAKGAFDKLKLLDYHRTVGDVLKSF